MSRSCWEEVSFSSGRPQIQKNADSTVELGGGGWEFEIESLLHSSDCPGTHYINQVYLEYTDPPASSSHSAEVKGLSRHLAFFFLRIPIWICKKGKSGSGRRWTGVCVCINMIKHIVQNSQRTSKKSKGENTGLENTTEIQKHFCEWFLFCIKNKTIPS